MKLIDAISKNAHTLHGTRGQKYRVRHLHGDRFYNAWDSLYGLFDVELLQLGRYAQSIQNSETENNMVSRIATTIPEKRKAQTSGFLIQFSPEKTERVEDTPSQELTLTSSTPHLLDHYDKLLQSSQVTEVAGRSSIGRINKDHNSTLLVVSGRSMSDTQRLRNPASSPLKG